MEDPRARVNVHGKITPETRDQQALRDQMWTDWEEEQKVLPNRVALPPKPDKPVA
jgi:hypothetical protein